MRSPRVVPQDILRTVRSSRMGLLHLPLTLSLSLLAWTPDCLLIVAAAAAAAVFSNLQDPTVSAAVESGKTGLDVFVFCFCVTFDFFFLPCILVLRCPVSPFPVSRFQRLYF